MMDLTLCLRSEELRSRVVAAAVMMQANVRELGIDYLLKTRDLPNTWVLVDHDLDQIRRVINHLQAIGHDPRKQVIRFIDKPWHAYVYHDLPIFASIVNPADPIAAVEIIRKLDKALPFLDQGIGESDKSLDQELDPFSDEFVRSSVMKHAVNQLRKLAHLPVDTVLLGETGSGKDTCAHWLHQQSGLKGEFVHINCAALPEQLFEAELFGVMAGAFTGAQKDRPGKLEVAHGGTLYLDEIDSMPLSCQAKLLNALQYRGATRLGGSKFYQSDFRVIASTKVDFPALVRSGKFREDLYFRLNISQIRIPALRERLEDIVPLYEYFLKQAAAQFKLPVPEISTLEWDELMSQAWNGNVRELRAYAQRRAIGLDVQAQAGDEQNESLGLKERLLNFEKILLIQSMKFHKGCTKSVSDELKIPLHSLYYRLKRFEIPLDESSSKEVSEKMASSVNFSRLCDT